MIAKESENLIIKYLSRTANITDLDKLNDWIASPENQSVFKTYVRTHFAIILAMEDPDQDKIRKLLLKKIRKERPGAFGHRFKSVLKYAAIAIVFLGLGLLVQQDIFNRNRGQLVVPREDAITLQLENGDIEIIAEDSRSTVIKTNGRVVGRKVGRQLVYEDDKAISKLIYNTLSVPNGKRFNIRLSDGTLVHLNARSSMKYPVRFINDSIRQVSLTGEAYFDIVHDDQQPFVVKAHGVDVKAYGTQFNVTNYREDRNMEVVLVEGSVSLTESGKPEKVRKEFFLKPGFMGSFHKTEKDITSKKVNTRLYTSWMDGNLVFRNTLFENIVRKLERHYNVIIINNNQKLAGERFNATIETDRETIEQVFNYFNKVYDIEYRILENKIIID